MPYGGGVRALEHHSESLEAVYAHIPGLKVVIPSNPYDAKGLLVAAVRGNDPVIFMEPKRLYRKFRAPVPDELYQVPIGKANVLREGNDVTVIAWGSMLDRCKAAVEKAVEQGVDVELIDLRTIQPYDRETLVASFKKTGRAVIVHEACPSFGPGAELIAALQEDAFYYMQAPIKRLTGYDTMVPLGNKEDWYFPDTQRIVQSITEPANAN